MTLDLNERRVWRNRFVLLAFAIFLLLIARKPDAVLNPQFWAEDGRIFFRDQVLFGASESLLRPYMGYYQPAQRLTALVAGLFPVAHAPLVYNLVALALASLSLALFLLPHFRYLIHSDLMRLTICLLAATAFYADELVGTLTNVHWFLFLAGVLVVSAQAGAEPGSSISRSIRMGAGFLLGVAAPMLIIVLPLAMFRLIRANWRDASAALAVASGALLHASVAFVYSGPIGVPANSAASLSSGTISAFVSGVALQSLVGHPLRVSIAHGKFSGFIVIAVILLAAWLIWLGFQVTRENRFRLLAALYVALASIAIAIPSRQVGHHFTGLAYAGDRGSVISLWPAAFLLMW